MLTITVGDAQGRMLRRRRSGLGCCLTRSEAHPRPLSKAGTRAKRLQTPYRPGGPTVEAVLNYTDSHAGACAGTGIWPRLLAMRARDEAKKILEEYTQPRLDVSSQESL